MASQSPVELAKELIKVFDDLLSQGDWSSTLYLKVSGKRIEKLRDQAKDLLAQAEKENVIEKPIINTVTHQLVYVSLYQLEANTLKKWEELIISLASYALTRPIYQELAHIHSLIRSKSVPSREAYVAVWVNKEDILPAVGERNKMDRLGHPLMTLRAGAVKPEHIQEFVHLDRHYAFDGRRLVLEHTE